MTRERKHLKKMILLQKVVQKILQMTNWDHDENISMVKNEDYWDADNVALDQVE